LKSISALTLEKLSELFTPRPPHPGVTVEKQNQPAPSKETMPQRNLTTSTMTEQDKIAVKKISDILDTANANSKRREEQRAEIRRVTTNDKQFRLMKQILSRNR